MIGSVRGPRDSKAPLTIPGCLPPSEHQGDSQSPGRFTTVSRVHVLPGYRVFARCWSAWCTACAALGGPAVALARLMVYNSPGNDNSPTENGSDTMFLSVALLAAGIVLLVLGGDLLVRGAAGLARALGVSTLVIGLTIVAFGTSAPELAVNVLAAVKGKPDISFGNIVGSNIANIGLIVGLACLFRPVVVHLKVIVREIPFMLLVTVLACNLALDGYWWGTTWTFDTNDGVTLLLMFLVYLYYLTSAALEERGQLPVPEDVSDTPRQSTPWLATLTLTGLAMVVAGGELTVRGAEGTAMALGVGREIIGLTIVAVGTSLPELATSLAAAIRKHEDIAIGNVVGSNVFNLLFIMGTTAVVNPVPVPRFGLVDLLAMLGFSAVLLPIAMSGRRQITRPEGAFLLLAYAAFVYVRFVYLGMPGPES